MPICPLSSSSICLKHQPNYVYLQFHQHLIMDSCDRRVRAYKNGKTFDQSRDIAESLNPDFRKQIEAKGKVLWTEILTQVNHDELIYKLTLKYLRRDGYDIGNHKIPEVKKFTS